MPLRARRQQLLGRRDLHGDRFCTAYAAAADEWLGELLEEATGGDTDGLSLMAVGGYGRGELCPYSDLDVVLVHAPRRKVGPVADAIWYPVWDQGVRLDHSVRSPDEVLKVATTDLRVQLGLLDGRLVAGDPTVVAPLLERARRQWRDDADRWLPVLARQVAERHESAGDVAFLLEPELKESHGGLRDVAAARAAALGRAALADLVDVADLDRSRAVLTDVRVELHRLTGRATDRLLLQEQDQVAEALGCADADALMAQVAEAGRRIAWVVDDLWRRRSVWEARPGRRHRRRVEPAEPTTVPIEDEMGVALVFAAPDGPPVEASLTAGADPAADLTLGLRLAAVAAERDLPISRASLDRLAARMPTPPTPWPESLRHAFVRVLAAGHPAIAAVEALDQRGLLVRLLPEWAAVRNRPQRNAYHRFTVDRHLLEAAANAAPLAVGLERPDLLLVGALLHDIGKGYPGDHTEVGERLMADIAGRMGFSSDDVATLVALVHHHLLLPDVATRRDLDDPTTIAAVADAVGDVGRLRLLAALTEADSLATGPAAWGTWKAGLVSDLVSRAAALLGGAALPERPPALVTDEHRALMAEAERTGRPVVVADGAKVTVVARDRPGILAAATGVLALHGFDVRSANAGGADGYAVDVFTVESARRRRTDWQAVTDDLEAATAGRLALRERLTEQARVYETGRASSARAAATSVTVDNRASATSTVVEVRAEDAVGLLHRVTDALFASGLDVVAARVSTVGHEVVDAFYVRDRATGDKVSDPERLHRIDRDVYRAAHDA